MGKILVQLDEEARSKTLFYKKQALSVAGDSVKKRTNSSSQLWSSEGETVNKAKLPLGGKNRNKTKKHGHAGLC